jgi:hypothetical protein
MNSFKTKQISKGIVEIILLLTLVGCVISTQVFEESKEALRKGLNAEDVFSWGTSHCIVSLGFVFIILIHIGQHWKFLQTLISKNLYLKNKLTTLTFITFFLTVVSILLYLTGFTFTTLHIHSMFAHLLVLMAIIHFISMLKRLVGLFK